MNLSKQTEEILKEYTKRRIEHLFNGLKVAVINDAMKDIEQNCKYSLIPVNKSDLRIIISRAPLDSEKDSEKAETEKS